MNNEEKKTILKEINFEVSMPNKIIVGDPMYFEQFAEYKAELDRLTYIKNFRGKSEWKGFVKIIEISIDYKLPKSTIKVMKKEGRYTSDYGKLNVIEVAVELANSENFLTVLKDNMKYDYQSLKELEIGVDSATIAIGINDNYIEIGTGGDGYIGSVKEYKKGKVLEGISLSFSFDADLNTIYEIEDIFRTLFK